MSNESPTNQGVLRSDDTSNWLLLIKPNVIQIEVPKHAYQHIPTGKVVEFKTKLSD